MNFGDPRLPDRFWSKCTPEPNTGCWLWFGALNEKGYGKFLTGSRADGSRRSVRSHRYAYETLIGGIPSGLECDHVCRVRCCVNPAHIEPVTTQINQLRGSTLAAVNSAKDVCPLGHAYNAVNTRTTKDGKRICRACHARRESERRTERLRTDAKFREAAVRRTREWRARQASKP
jgi:hypothetical protein